MHADIRRLATNLDVKIHGLQQMFSGGIQQSRIDGVMHLKEFIQSAATVLSSTSTVLSIDESIDEDAEPDDDFRSDFGDWFKTEVTVSTLDWIYSTDRNTPIFDLGLTNSAPSLAGSSQLGGGMRPPSLRQTIAAGQLSQEALNLNISNSKNAQPNKSLPQLENKVAAEVKLSSKADLMPAVPTSPSRSPVKSPGPSLSTSSSPKEKRRSLLRLFTRRGRPLEPPEQNLKAKKLSLFHKPEREAIRRKLVFVGDGGCGKTCYLM